MKKVKILLLVLVCALFALFAVASGDDTSTTEDQGEAAVIQTQEAEKTTEAENNLGDYSVEITSSRLAKDYEGKDLIIVKYTFTNVNGDEPASFAYAFSDYAFQNGVGLNESYFVDESANYDSNNQLKDIKKGASLEVEVAYELNDTSTPVEIEIEELFSFEDKTITKTFEIA